MPLPKDLLLQQLLLLLAASSAVAQFGLRESVRRDEDFAFPEFAQPWAVGQNVCAFLRTADGRRIFTTCFAYRQKVCGADTEFEYDCCPGYGHDAGYEGYKTGPSWSRSENCLKKLADSDMSSSRAAYLQRLGVDDTLGQKLRDELPRTSGQVTVFLARNGTYDTARFRAGAGLDGFIVRGGHFSQQLLHGSKLALAAGSGSVKISKYSNGIVCAECRRLMSADHPLDGRAVMHFTDGFVYSRQQSVAAVLESEFGHFWADVPAELRRQLEGRGCSSSWFTVLVPSADAWSRAKAKLGGSGDVGKLVRQHTLSSLLCAAAVCAESVANKNLNGESVRLGCDSRGVYASATHEFVANSKAYFLRNDGEIDNMATNGVVYQLDGALLPSSAFSFNEVSWPNVPASCVQLEPGKKYIFLIPRSSAWDRFNNSDARINSEESMRKFSEKYAAEEEYRCLVKKYHVLEADDPSLERLWSQLNPAVWPGGSEQPGSFRTLARWSDSKRSAYGFLRNHLHFQKADTGPRLHFQFAPVRQAAGFDLREGRGYMVDWVNIPPHESAADFFERRSDLAFHKKFVEKEAKDAGRGWLYQKEAAVQLIIVSKDEWYRRSLPSDNPIKKKKVTNFFEAVANNWNATDYLLVNWANLYFWIGDVGFMGRGERVYLQSGHPALLIGVYRHITNGQFFVWHEFKDTSPEPMASVRSRWLQVVEFNHFKTDAMIWIVDQPLPCSKRLCRNSENGYTLLPWSFAAACGDFVALPTTKDPAVAKIFSKAAGSLMSVITEASNKRLTAGPEAGNSKNVSCFGAAMLMTRKYSFVHDDSVN